MTSSPARIGTPSHDSLSTAPTTIAPCAATPRRSPRTSGCRVSDDRRREALAERPRLAVDALALDRSRTARQHPDACVVQRRSTIEVGVEDAPDALADELDDRVELELRRQRLADLVDQGQLGVALSVSQSASSPRTGGRSRARRPCSTRASTRSRSCGVGEGVPTRVGEGDRADDLVAGRDGHAEPRLGRRRFLREDRAGGESTPRACRTAGLGATR